MYYNVNFWYFSFIVRNYDCSYFIGCRWVISPISMPCCFFGLLSSLLNTNDTNGTLWPSVSACSFTCS
uniref:Uncharacterized protein n=1 Tax=Acrobeloides nanus TaxID=290746 RepID=A0A914C2C1_9BILA